MNKRQRLLFVTRNRMRATVLLTLITVWPFTITPLLADAGSHCALDMVGRRVCLGSRMPRIISLSPGTTELLFAAGAGPQVIAVDQHSDYPKAAKKLPKVGGYLSLNVEAIVAMGPDLVVVWQGGDSPTSVSQLESFGIKTFYLNIETLADIVRALQSLGKISGTSAQAQQEAASFNNRVNRLRQQHRGQPSVSVLFELWRSPLMAVGRSLFINDVIALCGGDNIYNDRAVATVTVNVESVISRNPQIIFGSDPRGDTPDTRQELLAYWGQWSTLRAVKSKQLFTIPSDWITRPTPRLLNGAEIICAKLEQLGRLQQSTGK